MGQRFRKFFYTYITFSLFTIVLALIAYALSYTVIRDAAVESGRAELAFAQQVVEARIDDLYNTVGHLAVNPDLNAVAQLRQPLPYPEFYDLIRFQRLLPQFNITDTFIESVYVYFFDARIMVSTAQTVVRMPFFYRHFFRHGDLSFREWDALVRSGMFRRSLLPRTEVDDGTRHDRRVLFYQSFPMDSIAPRGVIMVHIPEERFISYLGAIETGADGFVAVLNPADQVVAADGNPESLADYLDSAERFAGSRFTVLESNSSQYGLRFVAAIPSSLFYERVNLVRLVFLAIIAAELLLGVALARYFAIRDMKPLQELLDTVAQSTLDGSGGGEDEYDLIRRSFADMVRDNTRLRDTISRQAPLLKSTFIEQLLSGKFADRDDLELARRSVGVEFRHSVFAVCLASARERVVGSDMGRRFANQPVVQALLEDGWRESIPFDSFSYNTEPGSTAFVLNLPRAAEPGSGHREYEREMRKAVRQLSASLRTIRKIRVSVSCSDLTSDPLDLRALYTQAKSIHDYQLIMDREGAMFHSELGDLGAYRALFDLDSETALTRHVLAGRADKASDLLDERFCAVDDAEGLSKHSIELFLEQLETAVLRVSGELVFTDEAVQDRVRSGISRARSHVSFRERFDELKSLFLDLCAIVDRHKQTRNDRLLSDMQRYLSENFAEPQLGLTVLADAFHLSPGYVSRYFKEHAGIGMSEYLEDLRISRATELLQDPRIAVGTIAHEVGYTSQNTFYKAFRRLKGMSAGTYREQLLADARAAAVDD